MIVQFFQVGGIEEIDRVPADGPGEMALQGGGELDHVGQQHLGVLGRGRHRQGMRQVEAEFLDVLQGLAGTVWPVDEAQVVQVQIAAQVGVGHVRGEDVQQGVFLLDALGQGQVGGLGAMGNVGVFLVVLDQELVHVVERHPEAGMHAPGLFQPHLQELGVDQFADQRSGDGLDRAGLDGFFHVAADFLGGIAVDEGLAQQGVDDALAVPAGDVFLGGADEEGLVGTVVLGYSFQALPFLGLQLCDYAHFNLRNPLFSYVQGDSRP